MAIVPCPKVKVNEWDTLVVLLNACSAYVFAQCGGMYGKLVFPRLITSIYWTVTVMVYYKDIGPIQKVHNALRL